MRYPAEILSKHYDTKVKKCATRSNPVSVGDKMAVHLALEGA